MNSKAQPQGAASHAREFATPVELRIGQEVITIWFDAYGIHFRHPEGKRTEGVLPWDIAIAMSLAPEDMRRTLTPIA